MGKFKILNFTENMSEFFVVSLDFQSPNYKEIKQIRAYNVQSLVGNSGGYIGLFLGYTIKVIPNYIQMFYDKLKK